jgi:glycosyltransferase involved in cell wall biosynthesis
MNLLTKLLGSVSIKLTPVTARRFDTPLPPKPLLNPLTVSVVVVTFGSESREASLRQCIAAIATQTIKPKEVIIVDDGQINVVRFQQQLDEAGIKLVYIHKNTPGISQSRNLGIEQAIGEVVAFVDDDVVLAANYLEEILRVFTVDQEKKIGGVDGIYATAPKTTTQKIGEIVFALRINNHNDGQLYPNGVYHKINHATTTEPTYTDIFGGIACFRQEVLQRFHFDEVNFPGYSPGEDADLAYRVSREYRLITTPYAIFTHERGHNGRPSLFRLAFMKTNNVYRFMRKNTRMGLVNHLLMGWYFQGKLIEAAIRTVLSPSDLTKNLLVYWGYQAGIAACLLGIPAESSTAAKLANWAARSN